LPSHCRCFRTLKCCFKSNQVPNPHNTRPQCGYISSKRHSAKRQTRNLCRNFIMALGTLSVVLKKHYGLNVEWCRRHFSKTAPWAKSCF
jgi:hypothetical protein